MTYADLYDPAAPPEPPEPPVVGPPGGHGDDGVPSPGRRRPFDRAAAARLLGLAVASGVALDVGIRGGPANLVVVVGLVLAVVALALDPHVERDEARWLALAALVPAAFLAVRLSPWLVMSNLAAAAGLAAAAICLAQDGSLLDTTPARLVLRGFAATGRALFGANVLRPLVPRVAADSAKLAARVALALAITVPLLLALGALLAAADAVFAGMVDPDIDPSAAVGHVVLTGIAAFGVLGAVAAARGSADDRIPPGRFGALEISLMLGLATLVMALFAVAQIVAATDAGDRLIEDAGLTPAEYARSGFFQLCWAAALIVAFLALVRALAAPGVLDRPAMRALAAAVPLLALGLVGVSLRRMALYDEAFGLTMLRLWVVGAAVWMGVVLLLIAARNLGLGAGRDWVLAGSALAAFVLVVTADLANPEAFVVRHNVDRAAAGAELDVDYLADLSEDALPAYVDAAEGGAPEAFRPLLRALLPCPTDLEGVATLNLSAARASDVC
jgi:hypothetical protein